MKARRTLIPLLAIICAALLLPGFAESATKTPFVGIETFVAELDPGSITFPAGKVHFRRAMNQLTDDTDNDQVTGTSVIVGNGNLDGLFPPSGQLWGSWHTDVNAGGSWDGKWTGRLEMGVLSFRGTGHGSGDLEGLKIKIFGRSTSVPGISEYWGWVIDPHGK